MSEKRSDPPGPIPSRDEIADLVTMHTCMRRCFGRVGNAAGCCRIGERDFIIGPVPDVHALLERLQGHLGRAVAFDEVFIGFEEGRAMHPDKPSWQRPECYPALRVRADTGDLRCVFLGDDDLCTIHTIRSQTCANFFCDHLKALLDRL